MSNQQSLDRGGIHHIRVRGEVEPEWLARFEGFIKERETSGATRLVGFLADQDALHALLEGIRERGWPLLLVAAAECPCPKKKCIRRGLCPECQAYHALKGRQPYCLRRRTAWDKALSRLT